MGEDGIGMAQDVCRPDQQNRRRTDEAGAGYPGMGIFRPPLPRPLEELLQLHLRPALPALSVRHPWPRTLLLFITRTFLRPVLSSAAIMASAVNFRRDLLGIPNSTASPVDSSLIIIDAQNEYAEGKLAVTNPDSSRKAIASLVHKYRQANGNIVHVRHRVPEGAPVFTPGTRLAEEFEELAPREGEEVIYKQFPGSFAETTLHEHLESKGSKKLVLVGYMAHVCVSTTAREAHQRGYEVVLPEDAIGDRDIPGVSGDELTKVGS